MRKVSIQLVAVVFSLFLAACNSHSQGDFKNELTGPSGGVAIVTFAPPTLVLSPLGSATCLTSFNLVVDARAVGDLFMDAASFRFIDGSSIGRTPLFSWFTAPELNTLFGQTLIAGGSSRSFAFSPQFGCDNFHPQTVTANVTLRDRSGSQQQMSASSSIR